MPALLTAQDCTGHIHLVIGSGPLAASRYARSLAVGAHPILVAPADTELHYTFQSSIDQGILKWTQREFQEEDLSTLGRKEVGGYVDAVFVTTSPRTTARERISDLCKRSRIPVNVVDAPELCTFTLLSTHSDGPLQIGVTTSGRGCKLSSRIRREIVSSLPTGLGDAVERLGTLRKRIWAEDSKVQQADGNERPEVEDEEAAAQKHTFNALVKEGDKSAHVNRTRRMRWLSQVCEYWPLARLAAVTDSDVSAILEAYRTNPQYPISPSHQDEPLDILPHERPKGSITLAGSGPGHPSLLTIAAHRAIKSANFILADKLVPAEVLALVPRRTPVHIARKFPGNADAAQQEMHELALQALERGENVLRLKQGDPYLYGRGAEEVEFFQRRGIAVKVIPGVTSSLSAPLFAGIPVTHRGIADEVLICTGTGRKGAAPDPPAYRKGRTVVFLMALHRLGSLVQSLEGAEWPKQTPCAVIERASCPDQRVIRTKLEYVCQAVEEEGSRPPGLLVVGEVCEVLHQLAHGRRWITEEAFRGLDGVGVDDEGLSVLKDIEVAAKETGMRPAQRE
jgi:uroporphyrin-III C-methyltransferase